MKRATYYSGNTDNRAPRFIRSKGISQLAFPQHVRDYESCEQRDAVCGCGLVAAHARTSILGASPTSPSIEVPTYLFMIIMRGVGKYSDPVKY